MSGLQITIRQAEAAGVAALSVLAAHTYALAFGHSMSAEDLATQIRETRSESYFRRAMQTDSVLVAVASGKIAGYVQLTG